MRRCFFIFLLIAPLLYGGFWPDFHFAYDRSDDNTHVDKNFVRDDQKKIVLDKKHHKIYYDAKPFPPMTYDEAVKTCEKLDYLGYTNWRLPTKEEMRSLLELSRRSVTVKHAFKNIQEVIYWSSTKDGYKEAWYFDFDLGRYFVDNRHKKYRVICVGVNKPVTALLASD